MSELVEVRAPREQSEGTRSQVLRWLRSVGEQVEADEPLLELETDKVTIEIAAPASGLLREIVRREREEVGPGELLGQLELATSQPAAAEQVARAEQTEDRQPAAPRDASLRLSPAVRRLLKEHGLEPALIRGTGRDGRITAADVSRHLGAADAASSSTPRSVAKPPATVDATGPSRAAAAEVSTRRVPHSAMRQRVAEHMVRSLLHTAPHVTTVFEADLSAVIAHRSAHRADFARQGADLTLTAYFVAATVAAIRAVPEANARWTDTALEIHDEINIGIATALGGDGLIVPVLRNAQTLNLLGVAQGLGGLVRQARDGTLTPADVQGGTFTISNHGVSGSLIATPIVINQPQSAILGIGKLQKRVIVRDVDGADALLIRPMCYVTLTIDHRVMDGFTANRFLQAFTTTLEHWSSPD